MQRLQHAQAGRTVIQPHLVRSFSDRDVRIQVAIPIQIAQSHAVGQRMDHRLTGIAEQSRAIVQPHLAAPSIGVDHKRIQLQTLVYSKTEQLRSSLGKLDLLQLEHKANKGDYRFTFWCAKQLQYLPIKIRKIEQDGDVILLKLRRLDKLKFQLYDQTQANNEEI